ncbi:MAG: S41 family peptidase [Planctomycetota bacterium]|jgi:carboxyl-terminal processing protease
MNRAYPPPSKITLVEKAVIWICDEFQRVTQKSIAIPERAQLIANVLQGDSFEFVLNELKRDDSRKVNRQQLIGAGLKGMLIGTGWSSACVLSGNQADELKRIMENRETGVEQGIVGLTLDRWPHVKVIPDLPAAKAGLRNGDVILMVDSRDVSELSTVKDAKELISGHVGEIVNLIVKRGSQTIDFKVPRTPAAAAMIRWKMVNDSVVNIKIPTFEGSGVAKRVKQILSGKVAKDLSAVFLDLRDNYGGRPEEANAIADLLLDGKILQIFEYAKGQHITFMSNPKAWDVRVIVLTNRNTGSGAEMLAMALRDNRRAMIVGERTAGALFGKDFEELEFLLMLKLLIEGPLIKMTSFNALSILSALPGKIN